MSKSLDLEILITAEEAYPAFERAVLDARDRIDMGFRIFDARTKLVSDEARAIGDTWVDLLALKLSQGVKINIKITDFDPIVRSAMHYQSWKSLSVLMGAGEISGQPGNLDARVLDHPSRVGWGPRLVLWPKVMSEIAKACSWIDGFEPDVRADHLRNMPHLRRVLADDQQTLKPKTTQIPPLLPATHHQKLAVIDDALLYIGGLDLSRSRMDTQNHRGEASHTWHDVQVMVRDPDRARAARMHLDRFQSECRGEAELMSPPGLLRTLSTRRSAPGAHMSPDIADTSLADAHFMAISKAERLIYMESQFFRDPELTAALVERAECASDLGLVLVLPAAPQEVAFEQTTSLDQKYGEYLQAQCLERLKDAFGDRLFVGAPAQKVKAKDGGRHVLHDAPMIFNHSKVAVFDDFAGFVSSANLNGRSMRWDTEIGIALEDPAQVAHLRARTMRAWLPRDASDAFWAAKSDTVERWQRLALQNAATAPASRRGFILPFDEAPGRRFGSNLPGVPAEMV